MIHSVLAVDLGGTKLATAVVDSDGQIRARRKVPVSRDGVRSTAEQIAGEARSCMEEAGATWAGIGGVGIIVPGIYRAREGTAWAPNLWGDQNVDLSGALREVLPAAVSIDSDRAGYVLGEHWLGAAKGFSDVVFLAVGTGIGAGILSGGRLVRGAGDIAGAVGWFALSPEYKEEYRIKGCWESEAAGPGLAQRLGAASAEEVVEAARRGDSRACEAVAETVRYLGMGIANLISLLNPEVVVLGGGLMQAGDLFLEPVRQAVLPWAQPYSAQQVRIELSQLGESAGLLGAARLALIGPGQIH
ncbi:MAG: ROK family protein [Bryobacteraceae bacterium]